MSYILEICVNKNLLKNSFGLQVARFDPTNRLGMAEICGSDKSKETGTWIRTLTHLSTFVESESLDILIRIICE